MTADEFRAELKELGITQRWLASTLGVSANTVNRWATGEIPVVPQYAVAYLSLLRRGSNFDLIGAVCKILYGNSGDLPSLARDLGVELRWVQRWKDPKGNADPLPHHMRQMLCLVLENLPEEDG